MKEFNAEKTANEIISFIRDYYKKNNLKGVVLGISGGKDSGVVAGLFAKAIGPENMIGLTLPCHSKDEDRVDAKLISDYYGFKLVNVNLTDAFDSLKEEAYNTGKYREEDFVDSDINLKPRLRTAMLYYFAALYSHYKEGTYIVAGTGNKCEIFVGYFTKGGDGLSDIMTLADLTVDEVIKVGEYLNVPDKVLHKTPNDGLSGKSDEEKLGVTYKDIASYMENPESVEEPARTKIKTLHQNSAHKFYTPTYRKND